MCTLLIILLKKSKHIPSYTSTHSTRSIKSCFWGAVKCLHFALNASANNLCEKTTASKSCTNFKPTTDMLLSSSHQQILASQKKKKKKCKEKKQDLKLLKSTALWFDRIKMKTNEKLEGIEIIIFPKYELNMYLLWCTYSAVCRIWCVAVNTKYFVRVKLRLKLTLASDECF